MQYDFDEIIDRSMTHSIKIDDYADEVAEGSIPLWVADMDFACAQPILDALHERIDKRIFGYTNTESACKTAVVNWFERRYGWSINPEHIVFSPGVVSAIGMLINLLTDPGDGIVIQQPVYYPFSSKIKRNGRRIVNNPLIYKDGHYYMDYDDLRKKLSDPTVRGIIFCSPHNPVGRVWTEEEIQSLVAICKEYNKWIICDEIHCDLTRMGIVNIPILKLCPEYADNIVACTAPSKTFNLAGMQMSGIVIPNSMLRHRWEKLFVNALGLSTSNPLSMTAFVTAYEKCEDWLDQLRSYIDGNIQAITEYVKRELPKATVIYPEGTYLLWLDLNAYCDDVNQLEYIMREKAGVILDEGYIFGEEGANFERINVASPRSILLESIKRIRDALVDRERDGL